MSAFDLQTTQKLIKFVMEMESKQKRNQFAQQKAKQFSSRILKKIMMMQKKWNNRKRDEIFKQWCNHVELRQLRTAWDIF